MYTMKQARVGAGLTQAEMAEKIGCNVLTYRKYEAAPYKMRIGLVLKFCDVVKLRTNDIFFADEGELK